jgi:hypothetical protein
VWGLWSVWGLCLPVSLIADMRVSSSVSASLSSLLSPLPTIQSISATSLSPALRLCVQLANGVDVRFAAVLFHTDYSTEPPPGQLPKVVQFNVDSRLNSTRVLSALDLNLPGRTRPSPYREQLGTSNDTISVRCAHLNIDGSAQSRVEDQIMQAAVVMYVNQTSIKGRTFPFIITPISLALSLYDPTTVKEQYGVQYDAASNRVIIPGNGQYAYEYLYQLDSQINAIPHGALVDAAFRTTEFVPLDSSLIRFFPLEFAVGFI